MTPERLFIFVAAIALMFAIIISINFILYFIRLIAYYTDSTYIVNKPAIKDSDIAYLGIAWALFYAFHHLVRYLN